MQIPQNFPQFEEKNTLIIVSGTHEARFMTAHQGNLAEIHQFKSEKITYSDREGHFLRRAFGRVFGSGSVHEPPKERELIEFLDEFETHTKKVLASSKPEKIILLAPDYAQNAILEKIPQSAKKNLFLIIGGNFYNSKPLQILAKIKKKMDEKAPPEIMSEEAKKILEKGES